MVDSLNLAKISLLGKRRAVERRCVTWLVLTAIGHFNPPEAPLQHGEVALAENHPQDRSRCIMRSKVNKSRYDAFRADKERSDATAATPHAAPALDYRYPAHGYHNGDSRIRENSLKKGTI